MPLQAQRGGGGTVPIHSQPITRRMLVDKIKFRPLYPWEKNRYPFFKILDRPRGRSGRQGIFHPTGMRSPERAGRGKPLYLLR